MIMNKVIVMSLLVLMSSMTMAVYPKNNVPPTLRKWMKGENINWTKAESRTGGEKGADWRDKFSSLEERVDAQTADMVWAKINTAKAAFHQENLWILTSGNDSLVAAMIDVEWAFDGMFVMYFVPAPGGRTLRSLASGGFDASKMSNAYNNTVGKKMEALLQVGGIEFDPRSESVRFANAIKKWTVYNTVGWNESDSLTEECPEKYFKHTGRNHQRADVRTEWVKVQNSIMDFREATKWVREKNNAKMNKALDEFEVSLMNYFRKYVREIHAVGMNVTVYSEIMPMAVDVLCMEYVSAIKTDKNR